MADPEKDLEASASQPDAASSKSWPTVTENELSPLWTKNLTQLAKEMGISTHTLYELLPIPTFPRYICGKDYYYSPFEVGIWAANNERACVKQKYSKRYRDVSLQAKSGKVNKAVLNAANIAGDEIDRELGTTTSNDPRIVEEKVRYMKIKGDAEQLKLEKEIEKLVDRALYEEDEAARYNIIKNKLLKFPGQLAPQLEQRPIQDIEDLLDSKLREVLEDFKAEIIEANTNSEPIVIEEMDK